MPWLFIFFDSFGIWLLLRSGDLVNFVTAGRAPASDLDRFIARVVGVIAVWMHITNWEARSKNTSVEPVTHWISAVATVGTIAFLGYHFLRLFVPKSNLQVQAETAKRRYLLPETEEEARVRYRAAWRKYRTLRVAFPLAFFAWLPVAYGVSLIFHFFDWNEHLFAIIMLAWIPFMSIFSWQWAFWQCPRCGYAFRGSLDLFFPKHCHHCKLPMWAESP